MSKITINQLHMALCEANSIMLTVHVRPDGELSDPWWPFTKPL